MLEVREVLHLWSAGEGHGDVVLGEGMDRSSAWGWLPSLATVGGSHLIERVSGAARTPEGGRRLIWRGFGLGDAGTPDWRRYAIDLALDPDAFLQGRRTWQVLAVARAARAPATHVPTV